jgi:serine protease 16
MWSLLLLLASASPTLAASPNALRSLEYSHLSPSQLRAPPDRKAPGPPPRFVTQKQDHFDASNTRTWQQAYFVNDTFWDGSGPVFLCVGGEGPALDGSAVVSSVHCNVAVEFLQATKALMFAVEHRYYGCHNASACPYDKRDKEPLKWLSSRQALEDLAAFHAYATDQYRLKPSVNKWVSFGGSYPGMLAGWFRVLYPTLVHASVSSSAPVHAKLDMVEYYDIAARAYSLDIVGGSDECEAAIRSGHEEVGVLMNSTSGRERLAALFPLVEREGADWLATRAGRQQFAGNGVAPFPSQSNDPACDEYGCNIAKICDVMTAPNSSSPNSSSPVERLAELARHVAARREPLAGRDVALAAGRRAADAHAHSWMDYWGWQTCTEFGFYQTCEVGSRCFFTQGLMLLADEDAFCDSDFGISEAEIASSIAQTNEHYGGLRPDVAHNASRILYVNGDVDPWSGLGILDSPSPSLPTLMVAGASHHAWTHPSADGDQPTVVSARKQIREQVLAWLAEK